MIPEAAVEAAAKGIYATEAYPIYDEAKEEFTGHKPWEWLNERSWDSYRNKARAALEAAAPYMLAAAKASALEEAANERAKRSDTLFQTMQNMAESREYELADIVRYGAYSAEAKTTAAWLRFQADAIRPTP